MARIKIDLPDKYLFETTLSVRITDINYGNHLANDRLLGLMHEARLQFFRSLGFHNELEFAPNIGIVMADVGIIYKSESFYGDSLRIQLGINDISRVGFDMIHHVSNEENKSEVAIGKAGIVCFDYKERKVAPIPQALLEKLT